MSEESTTKQAYRRKSRRVQRYHAVFGTDDGKWVLKDLMRRYRFFGQVTVAGEPRSTEFLDGQRTVVMDIIKTLETDLKKLIQLYESLPEDKHYE
jgi:hypothetical protein